MNHSKQAEPKIRVTTHSQEDIVRLKLDQKNVVTVSFGTKLLNPMLMEIH